jgi:UDPglucose 6-dehydrogenase
MAESREISPLVLRAVEQVNTAQKRRLFEKVSEHFDGALRDRCLAVWGLSFKPRTDDMREAPAVTLIEALLEAGARVQAHDPVALDVARRIFGDRIGYHDVSYDALRDADAALIVTEWPEFKQPDFARMKALMREPVIFDGRNLYELGSMRGLGFTYYAVGRPPVRD